MRWAIQKKENTKTKTQLRIRHKEAPAQTAQTATDQRSCHTKRHLPWSPDRTQKPYEKRKPKQLCHCWHWDLDWNWGWYWTLILYAARFVIEFHSRFLIFSRLASCDSRVCDRCDRHVWPRQDQMSHIHKCESDCYHPPYVWWVCGSAVSFAFCQLMIFIEFARGKKFAKFAAKCSLLRRTLHII